MQKRYTDLAMPAAEGYLIMMAMQFILMPVIFLMMFPAFLIPFSGSAGATILIVVLMIVIYIVAFMLGSLGTGIMLGGTVRVVDAIRNHEKPKFGDVFKYGWRNKWELFSIHFLNYLLIMMIFLIFGGIFFALGILIFTASPVAGLLFIVFGFLVVPFSLYFLMSLMYLPFVIRHKRGVHGTENITMAWREFFSEPITYGMIGFLYMLIVILLSMVPFLNIIVALALHVAFISTLLIHYDQKYQIPVMPEPIKYPPYGGYSGYDQYYQTNSGPQQYPDYGHY